MTSRTATATERPAMHTTARILAPLLLALAAIHAAAGTAEADAPSSVHTVDARTLEAGWVRAACATTDDGARCVLRFPEGASRVVLNHSIGGQRLGEEVSYIDRAEHRDGSAPQRRASANLAGVRVSCTNAGQLVTCDVDYPAGTENINTTSYVAGWNYGGLRAKGLVLA